MTCYTGILPVNAKAYNYCIRLEDAWNNFPSQKLHLYNTKTKL